jgi:hypothetical protein
MKEIILSQGMVTFVDDDDFEELNRFKWCAAKSGNTFYAYRKVSHYITLRMHRQILDLTDPKIFTDHIDGNGLNNQKENLRICTNQQNQMNSRKHKDGSSQYKGVYFDKRRQSWTTQIQINGKSIRLGRFKTEKEAAVSYDRAAEKVYGKFAKLNFPSLPSPDSRKAENLDDRREAVTRSMAVSTVLL